MSDTDAHIRLSFLDGLRGIAILMVLVQHFCENSFHPLLILNQKYLQVGQCGVALFFLLSGFVIPLSIEKHKSLKLFWINRVFRLYPVYWVSLLIAFYMFLVGQFTPLASIKSFLINLTMLQGFIGVPNIIGAYWSLKFEIMFYILISGLLVFNFLGKTPSIYLAYSVTLIFLVLSWKIIVGDRLIPYGAIYLNMMLYGWLTYCWVAKRVTTLKIILSTLLLVFTELLVSFVAFYNEFDHTGFGTQSFIPMLSAWFFALMIFWVGYLRPSYISGSFLIHWGLISYSAYVLHPLIYHQFIKDNGLSNFVLNMTLTWLASCLAYRYIERPFILIGKSVQNYSITEKKIEN